MLQELIVYLIGIAVTMLLISKVYKALFGKKDQKTYDGCSSCSCSKSVKRYRARV